MYSTLQLLSRFSRPNFDCLGKRFEALIWHRRHGVMPNSNIERATRLILLRKLYLENQIHFSRWDRCTVEDIYCSYCPAGVLLECSINQALRNDIEHTSKITLGVVFQLLRVTTTETKWGANCRYIPRTLAMVWYCTLPSLVAISFIKQAIILYIWIFGRPIELCRTITPVHQST